MPGFADRPFWLSLRGWFLGDVLASLVLDPTILLYLPRSFRIPYVARRLFGGEAAILFLSLLVVDLVLFSTDVQAPGHRAGPCCTSPVPWLIWASVRFGPRGLMSALSLTTILAIAGAVHGLGPFVAQSNVSSVLMLQLFLLGIGVPLFCLAGLVQERRESQARAGLRARSGTGRW